MLDFGSSRVPRWSSLHVVLGTLYYTSMNLKGDLIKYLKSDKKCMKCMKPGDKSVSDRQNRIKELIQYSAKEKGLKVNVIKDEQKMILFNSFPIAWQISYKHTQVTVQASNVEQVMIYEPRKEICGRERIKESLPRSQIR